MTPLDDELRRTLSDRAATVAPSPDPLGGIESRARGIRRRRVATSIAGAVAAVAAVAIAVPALTPGGKVRLEPAAPSPTPTVAVTPATPQLRPANVLTWELRGKDAYSPSTLDLRHRFVQAMGRSNPDDAEYKPLFVYRDEGVSFTIGQAWLKDATKAYTVSYSVGPDNVPQFFLGPVTPTDPWGLAFLITGQGNISLEVLDGNGDIDHPLYRGPVTPLLCGLSECG
jgi:hypothetical protein